MIEIENVIEFLVFALSFSMFSQISKPQSIFAQNLSPQTFPIMDF